MQMVLPRAVAIGRESLKRKITQLLRDYRTYHTAYGSAAELNLESLPGYGPGGVIERGAEFKRLTTDERDALHLTYRLVEYALTMLKGEGAVGMSAYLVLLSPYLGDPGDPSLVTRWRKQEEKWREELKQVEEKLAEEFEDSEEKSCSAQRRLECACKKWREENPKPRKAEWHDKAIDMLAAYLRAREDQLFVIFPKRMSSMERDQIERRNMEVVEVFRAFHYGDGYSRNKSIEKAAEHCGYSRSRSYEIVDIHEPRHLRRGEKLAG